ncbi:MAG: glycine-rich protein [Bilifractor sp.]
MTGSAGNTAVYANDQTQVMEAKDNSYANSVSDSSADSSSTSESVNTQQTETVSSSEENDTDSADQQNTDSSDEAQSQLFYADPLPDNQITDKTPLRAALLQTPLQATEQDNVITSFSTEPFYGGAWKDINGDGVEDYVWTAKSQTAGHRFNFRISFGLGTVFDENGTALVYPADSIHICVPKTILKDRRGGQGDSYEMSVPSKKDVDEALAGGEKLDEDMSFGYYEDGDDIVIYNFRDVDAGTDAFVELSYITNQTTFNYLDEQESDPFHATISVTDPADQTTHQVTGENQTVWIDTHVELLSSEARIPVKYSTWPWGAAPTEDGNGNSYDTEDYTYLVWEIRSQIDDNSQMYDFSVDDTFSGLEARNGGQEVQVNQDPAHPDIFPVAVRFSGNGSYTLMQAGHAVQNNQTQSGLRYDYVLLALKKSFWDNMDHWEISNDTKVTVTPADRRQDENGNWSGDDPSSETFTRKFSWNKPSFSGVGGGFGSWEHADGMYRYQAQHEAWPRVWLTDLGMNAGNYSRYDLKDLVEDSGADRKTSLDDLDYAVGVEGYALKWTLDPDYKNKINAAVKEAGEAPDSGKITDPSKDPRFEQYYYYHQPVKYVCENDAFYLFDENSGVPAADAEKQSARMGADDYQIDKVSLEFYGYDRKYNPDTASFDAADSIHWLGDGTENGYSYTDADGKEILKNYKEMIAVYARFGSLDAEWTHVADMSPKTGAITVTAEGKRNGVTASGKSVFFSGDKGSQEITDPSKRCLGYKLETWNTHYYTQIGSVPSIRIYNSAKLQDIYISSAEAAERNKSRKDGEESVVPTESIGVSNSVNVRIYDSGNDYTNCVHQSEGNDSDYVRIVEKDASLGKKVVSTMHDQKKKNYTVTWKVSMKETYTTSKNDSESDQKYIAQNGGIFFDLLPEGANLDRDSVMLVTQEGALGKNAFTIDQVQNYKGSGRTLLKVTAVDPGDYYELYYNTISPYESIRDYGNLLYNPIAYETGNGEIAHGIADDALLPSAEGGENWYKPLADSFTLSNTKGSPMTGGTAGRKDPSIQKSMNLLMQGLDTNADGSETSEGNKFIYGEEEFDLAAITSGASGLSKRVLTTSSSSWDNNGMTKKGQTYSYRLRFQNSYTSESKNLVFFDSLENCKAETGDGRKESDWKGTLSDVSWKATDPEPVKDKNGHEVTPAKVAPVLYISTQNLDFNNKTASEAQKDLSNPDIWKRVDPVTVNGKMQFREEDLKNAKAIAVDMRHDTDGEEYTLQKGGVLSVLLTMTAPSEADFPAWSGDGYPEAYNDVFLSEQMITSSSTQALTMVHQAYTTADLAVTGDVYVKKVSEQNPNEGIRGITFRLHGTSNYGTAVDEKLTSDRNGRLSFQDVEQGLYVLEEYDSTSDWLEDDTPHYVCIDKYGRTWVSDRAFDQDAAGHVLYVNQNNGKRETPRIEGKKAPDSCCYSYKTWTGASGVKDVKIQNKPRVHADVYLIKYAKGTSEGLTDTSFLLSGTSDYGNDIHKTGTTNSFGMLVLRDVEKGTYTLTETKANPDYVAPEYSWQVKVDDTGTAVVSEPELGDDHKPEEDKDGHIIYKELKKTGDLYYVLYNTPKYWDFSFLKVDAENTTRHLEGAKFTLKGNSLDTGKLESSSNSNGVVTFMHLAAGSYTLRETEAPTGLDADGHAGNGGTLSYLPDNSDYFVTVSKDGKITVKDSNGTELKKSDGTYIFPDARAQSGEIVIYKHWEDNHNADGKRMTPTVHLSTSEEALRTNITVTKQWIGSTPAFESDSAPEIVLVKIPYGGEHVVPGESVTISSRNADSGKWTKTSGSTWSYTFHEQIDPLHPAKYYVYENDVPKGYQSSADGSSHKTAVVSGRATITNTYTADRADFSYTGAAQSYTVPADGLYRLEAWGAQGAGTVKGKIEVSGGKGGYTSGVAYLKKGQVLYIYVGQGGRSGQAQFNGGGSGTYGGGGGATDFRLESDGQWDDFSSLKSRIMVAGGGGGASWWNWNTENGILWGARPGGYAGGLTGHYGYYTRSSGAETILDTYKAAGWPWDADEEDFKGIWPGGQTGQVTAGKTAGIPGGFGYGGNGEYAGGGGGYYGGNGGPNRPYGSVGNSEGTGAGGSSFISGYQGCDAVSETSVSGKIIHTGQSVHYSGIEFQNPLMLSGDDPQTSPDGKRETGHEGDGYARITPLENPDSPLPDPDEDNKDDDSYVVPETNYVTTADGWQKVDDDTYMYVMKVFNDNATYTAWEDYMDGYHSSAMADKNGQTSEAVTLDGSKQKSVLITNTLDNAYGSLTLGKKVVNPDGTERNSAQAFTFHISLKDSTGTSPAGSQTFGNTVFTDGKADVQLSNGENLTFDRIPRGWTFEITEESDENYEASASIDGQAAGSGASVSGTIDAAHTVLFTNTFRASGQSPKADVTLEKKLTGNTAAAQGDAYGFTMIFTGLKPKSEYFIQYSSTSSSKNAAEGEQPGSFVSDAKGETTVKLSLHGDEQAVVKDLPVGATYQFIEDGGENYTASFHILDKNSGTDSGHIEESSMESTRAGEALATAVETVEGNQNSAENVTVTFTNTLQDNNPLFIMKQVEGADGTASKHSKATKESFDFLISIYGLAPNASLQTDKGIWRADDDGNILDREFQLTDGEMIKISSLPVGARYTITEKKNRYIPSALFQYADSSEVKSKPINEVKWKDDATWNARENKANRGTANKDYTIGRSDIPVSMNNNFVITRGRVNRVIFRNTLPPASLPNTGWHGKPWWLTGAAIGAAALFIITRRRKRRADTRKDI